MSIWNAPLVKTLDDIRENMDEFDRVICEGTEDERVFARTLFGKTQTIIAAYRGGLIRFYPARFVGHAHNRIEYGYLVSDGGEASLNISKVLGSKHQKDSYLDEQLQSYLQNHGLTKPGKSHWGYKVHQYWYLQYEPSGKLSVVPRQLGIADGKELKFVSSLGNSHPQGSTDKDYSEAERYVKEVTLISRSRGARKACLDHFGTNCVICGFDAAHEYGELKAGLIHVHHLEALSDTSGERVVDPIKDLVPVCPNCHMVIHSKDDGCYTIEEMKHMLSSRQSSMKGK